MLDFLNIKVSTILGILILLLIAGTVGAMIFYQFYELMNIRIEVIEFKTLEKPSD